jgi:hypothetical protein
MRASKTKEENQAHGLPALFSRGHIDGPFSFPSVHPSHRGDTSFVRKEKGSPDSQKRRTAIIHSWQITGRSGEPATITLDAMAWDSFYQCLTAEVLQSKVIDC